MVAERLDRFLVAEAMLINPWIIKSLVTIGGFSKHVPIMLNISKGGFKPLAPLKLNHGWLKECDFKSSLQMSGLTLKTF